MTADPDTPEPSGPEPQPAGSALFDGAPAAAPPTGRPEVAVGAAFAGGLVAALILKRLGSHN